MRFPRFSRSVLFVLLIVPSTACSWLFVEGPPAGATGRYIPCTDSKTLPVLDVIGMSLQAMALGAALGSDEASYRLTYGYSRNTGIAVNLFWSAIFMGSAHSGFKRVQQCRDARFAAADQIRAGSAPRSPILRQVPIPVGQSLLAPGVVPEWAKVVASKSRGIFYVVNPGCRAWANIDATDAEFFAAAHEAESAGFRPAEELACR